MAQDAPIDDELVDSIAEEADVDARSVVRRLAGLPVRGRIGRRIDLVLCKRGLARGASAEALDK
jgi:hypothetical protein